MDITQIKHALFKQAIILTTYLVNVIVSLTILAL